MHQFQFQPEANHRFRPPPPMFTTSPAGQQQQQATSGASNAFYSHLVPKTELHRAASFVQGMQAGDGKEARALLVNPDYHLAHHSAHQPAADDTYAVPFEARAGQTANQDLFVIARSVLNGYLSGYGELDAAAEPLYNVPFQPSGSLDADEDQYVVVKLARSTAAAGLEEPTYGVAARTDYSVSEPLVGEAYDSVQFSKEASAYSVPFQAPGQQLTGNPDEDLYVVVELVTNEPAYKVSMPAYGVASPADYTVSTPKREGSIYRDVSAANDDDTYAVPLQGARTGGKDQVVLVADKKKPYSVAQPAEGGMGSYAVPFQAPGGKKEDLYVVVQTTGTTKPAEEKYTVPSQALPGQKSHDSYMVVEPKAPAPTVPAEAARRKVARQTSVLRSQLRPYGYALPPQQPLRVVPPAASDPLPAIPGQARLLNFQPRAKSRFQNVEEGDEEL